jgi:hypothetical protein
MVNRQQMGELAWDRRIWMSETRHRRTELHLHRACYGRSESAIETHLKRMDLDKLALPMELMSRLKVVRSLARWSSNLSSGLFPRSQVGVMPSYAASLNIDRKVMVGHVVRDDPRSLENGREAARVHCPPDIQPFLTFSPG